MSHYDDQRAKYDGYTPDTVNHEKDKQLRIDQLILDLQYIADHRPNIFAQIIKSVTK